MSRPKYDHERIEQKWQNIWESSQTFHAQIDHTKPKFYVLDMFPYPSGSGLHVGHVTGYTATDIVARHKRKLGFNVLHPMGWDSFGLPAEQYAIRTGTHPNITTQANIQTYRRQLKQLGFSYDWDREFATSDPKYYKWTQWIFTKLYEKGLAYEAEALVNYCPTLGTVLANEEVENGLTKEGGYLVERRPLKQWILKITAYADRLVEDLNLLDWPEHIKRAQINWVGRSEGMTIHFPTEKDAKEIISIFTTCPHTLSGVTFLVLAPEHPLIGKLTTKEQEKTVQEYCKKASLKTDLDRTDLAKDKTGVWTGSYVINPITNEKVPVWVADYVLINYGTGAVMGVPAHDERDFEFATLFRVPIKVVVDPLEHLEPSERDLVLSGKLCWSKEEGKMLSNCPVIANLSCDEAKKAMIAWGEKTGHGKKTIQYKLRDWLFSRQRYWGEPFPILHFQDGTKRVLDLDELPLCPPDLTDFKPSGTGESPLAKDRSWVELIDPKTGKRAFRETNTMPQWAGSCWYYLRFCDPHNDQEAFSKEAEKYWMSVDLYVGGVEHAVLHLLYARFWHKVLYDIGVVTTKEPFQTLRNQGLVTARSYQLPSGSYIAPDEVLEKNGKYYHAGSGTELKSQVEKMSKSKLNGVTPDEMIEEYGADALRLYETFMGPFDKEKLWNTDSVVGCYRFLTRVWDLLHSDKICDEETLEANKLGHRLLLFVTQGIDKMEFNTAIAKMMEFINDFSALDKHPKNALEFLMHALYPFAPHIAEEGWAILGHRETITFTSYPTINPAYLEDDEVLYIVQVNGKLRGRMMLPKDRTQEELITKLTADPSIAKHIESAIEKVVFVPNKLINIVCGK